MATDYEKSVKKEYSILLDNLESLTGDMQMNKVSIDDVLRSLKALVNFYEVHLTKIKKYYL